MIRGSVAVDRDALIRLTVRCPGESKVEVDAVIDTGFDGWFSLPPPLISQLGLPCRRRGRALLADGSESIFDTYDGTVVWDGFPRRVPVDEANTAPLVGMSLLEGFELKVQVRSGGNVTIEPLS